MSLTATHFCAVLFGVYGILLVLLIVDFVVQKDKFLYNQKLSKDCNAQQIWLIRKQEEEEEEEIQGTERNMTILPRLPCKHSGVHHRVAVHAVDDTSFVKELDINNNTSLLLKGLKPNTEYRFSYMQSIHKDCLPLCQYPDLYWATK